MQRLVQLVVNKLLHQPTTVLRESDPDAASARADALCALFGLSPIAPAAGEGDDGADAPAPDAPAPPSLATRSEPTEST